MTLNFEQLQKTDERRPMRVIEVSVEVPRITGSFGLKPQMAGQECH